jgi:hypothetical protein
LIGTLRLLVSYYLKCPPAIFQHTVSLAPGQSITDETFICPRARQPFTGRVYSAKTNEAISGARIRFHDTSGRIASRQENPLFFSEVTTNASGVFETKDTFLPEEIFRLLIYGNIQIITPGGSPTTYRTKQSSQGLRRLQADIVLQEPITLWVTEQKADITLFGRVVDHAGAPLARVKLNAESCLGIYQGRQRGLTDQEGRFEISNLCPGRWTLKAYLPKGPLLEKTVNLTSDNPSPDITLRVKNNCRLEGTITIDVRPSRMRVKISGLHYETNTVTIGSNLSYAFQYLPEGKALVSLELYQGRRYQESYLTVHEAWVVLKPGKTVYKNFSF